MKEQNELPELTGLQFLILEAIGAKKMRGADVRERLKEHHVHKTGPAFYQLMARLEEAKLVEGWYEQQVIDGQIIKRRCYRVTGIGERARRGTLKFYEQFVDGRKAYA
jgi:DNA-binding PadR family transcriptional regulator